MTISTSLRKIASSAPILGAPFAENNKLKRFTTDSLKFVYAILLMACYRTYSSKHQSMDMSMDMGSEMSSDMSLLSMFLIMFVIMRAGAMGGEIIANQATRCCEYNECLEEDTWRDHEVPKNWLSTIPVAGAFFKSASLKNVAHDISMDFAMTTCGTIGMMWQGLGFFEDTYFDWPASILRMYIGMALGMISVMTAFVLMDEVISTIQKHNEIQQLLLPN